MLCERRNGIIASTLQCASYSAVCAMDVVWAKQCNKVRSLKSLLAVFDHESSLSSSEPRAVEWQKLDDQPELFYFNDLFMALFVRFSPLFQALLHGKNFKFVPFICKLLTQGYLGDFIPTRALISFFFFPTLNPQLILIIPFLRLNFHAWLKL